MRFLVNRRNPEGGVSYHRLQQPFENSSFDYDFFQVPQEIKNLRDYDYLVFNRSFGWNDNSLDLKFIEDCKNCGLKIIIDIDDYWVLPDYHTIVWREDVNYPEWQRSIIRNMKAADYVWTSTPYLATKIREVVDVPVQVCRNALNYEDKMWTHPIVKKKGVNIGWIGSTTHHMDVDQLRRPLATLNKHHKVNMYLAGYSEGGWAGEVSKRFVKMFTDDGKNKNLKLIPPVHVKEYGNMYGFLDISLAPVLDNDFNRAKSELKLIESGARYVPFIGSDTLTYSRVDADCFDLCGNAQEWYESMREYMNKNLRDELGKELGEYVRDVYTFEKSNAERLSIL